jgi:3-oxoacyl-[acyl-carrier-protein] synthase III
MSVKIIGQWDYCPELIPKKTYTEASHRATMKWRAKNRDHVNKLQRERHAHKMRTDMDYRNMKAAAAKKANAKYKAKLDEARQVLKDIKEYENNFSDSD